MKKKDLIAWIAALALAAVSFSDFEADNKTLVFALNVLYVVAGFVMLIKGADLFVEAASKIAAKFNIPQMVIGLTIVACGTSLPEAAVSIKAALADEAGITVGNVVGSNIMNILLILGVASCVAALPIKKNTLRIDIPFVIIISVLLLVLGMMGDELTRADGLIFILLFAGFMAYLIISAKNGGSDDEATEVTKKDTMVKLLLFVVLGGVCIVLGSNVTVDAASYIAGELGMTARLIGLTIVAFGTSLPELVTSTTAARRGKTDIAIGNVVGSNIFNILFVVGLSALITDVPFEKAFITDSVVAIASVLILFFCVLKDKKLKRSGGALMLVCYTIYFAYILYMNYV